MTTLRIGSRGSALAMRQTELVVQALLSQRPGISVEIVTIRAEGDDDARPAWRTDTPGLFTNALTRALVCGAVDAAVHSLKDLPVRVAPPTVLGAILERGEPEDALIDREQRTFDRLPRGAVIGTSSLRRRAQILARRPDLHVVEIRGNVPHRLRQVAAAAGGLDAIVVAHAGVRRLGHAGVISEVLPADLWLPAPGQGAIAVEVRADDARVRSWTAALDHLPTRIAVSAERAVLSALGAGCHAPVGAFARRQPGGHWAVAAAVWAHDGRRTARANAVAALGSEADAEACGSAIATMLGGRGAAELMRPKEAVHVES